MSDTNGGQGNGTSPKVVEIHPQKDARTESLYEIRQKVYPRAVSGYFANWRWALRDVLAALEWAAGGSF
jgi:hypothetical protein